MALKVVEFVCRARRRGRPPHLLVDADQQVGQFAPGNAGLIVAPQHGGHQPGGIELLGIGPGPIADAVGPGHRVGAAAAGAGQDPHRAVGVLVPAVAELVALVPAPGVEHASVGDGQIVVGPGGDLGHAAARHADGVGPALGVLPAGAPELAILPAAPGIDRAPLGQSHGAVCSGGHLDHLGQLRHLRRGPAVSLGMA